MQSGERSEERLSGIVERVTFHSADTGWSVVKVAPFEQPNQQVTVVTHQVQVFAGATMDFFGHWTQHPKYGEQFKARHCVERKPASLAALEKYLGSGLIRGIGPKTAKKIVSHFGERTLEVFETDIEALTELRGIAERKLTTIREAWAAHKAVRDVMLFLQDYGVSTLFAVKIYKTYGDAAIAIVQENPYRLARDIFGIGFFSADRIALALGFAPDGEARIQAGIKHVLAASRDAGHCYLTREQVQAQTHELLQSGHGGLTLHIEDRIDESLELLLERNEVCQRALPGESGSTACFYSKTLYRDEESVAEQVRRRIAIREDVDTERVTDWLNRYAQASKLQLSDEQSEAVAGIVMHRFAILTGGPGCGKTTTTKALVKLVRAMGKRLLLAAPTGRAAQRMSEVIGQEARTIHRLLEWDPMRGGFKRDADSPLDADFVVIDEVSMLDISLCASLLSATPPSAQLLLIGDPHQLPSVGAGNVLADLLECPEVPRFALTRVFRQAQASDIIRHAHAINQGEVPQIPSPLAHRWVWDRGVDCLFLDADEATQEQLRFIRRARAVINKTVDAGEEHVLRDSDGETVGILRPDGSGGVRSDDKFESRPDDEEPASFVVPGRFRHVDFDRLARSEGGVEELQAVLKRIHPHSALRHGMSAAEAVVHLYATTVPQRIGSATEIQVLCPMNRGSLGAFTLNAALQERLNPRAEGRAEIVLGERVYRVGDRVIQRRNNYDKGVFNGDIGRICAIDNTDSTCDVEFPSPGHDGGMLRATYRRDEMNELGLAYAITIHKSQGSEFDAVVIPLATQHHKMLFRNLVYTGLTRAKKLAVFVGSRHALRKAIENLDSRERQTALSFLVSSKAGS